MSMFTVSKRVARLLLREYPETRNCSKLFEVRFIEIFCKGDSTKLTDWNLESIMRERRRQQNDYNYCPPDEEHKKSRENVRREYIKEYAS